MSMNASVVVEKKGEVLNSTFLNETTSQLVAVKPRT